MSTFSGTEGGFVNTSFVELSLTEIISHCPANRGSIGLMTSSFLQEVNVKPASSNNVNSGLI
ncbi:MAG TPA: hypothetical protein VK772_17060 [Puia sp.]|nr:hypothetical protein [Puia sp.]